jgi:hypothetical protein
MDNQGQTFDLSASVSSLRSLNSSPSLQSDSDYEIHSDHSEDGHTDGSINGLDTHVTPEYVPGEQS